LVDTVGFIRHLPHKLVDAFRATLQETAEATLLLHLVDASDEKRDDNIEEVQSVLSEIDADELPHLMVYNKIDVLEDCPARIDRDGYGVPRRVWLSALTGEGVELLVQAISERLGGEIFAQQIVLEPQYGNLRAQLYAQGAVEKESTSVQGQMVLDVRLQKRDFLQTLSHLGMDATPFVGKPSNPWD
jgi:GTP-binding protein HflX